MKTIQLDYNDLFIASLFTVVGDSVVIRSSGGDVLYTLPTGLGITTEESDGSTLTFTSGNYYFVIAGFPSTVQRDADNAILVAACNTGGGGGGGGGGAVTIADGADVAFGARADTAAISDTAVASYISLFKRLLGHITTLLGYTQPQMTQVETVVVVNAVSASIIIADPNRKYLKFFNKSGGTIHVSSTNPATTTSGQTYTVGSGETFDVKVPTNQFFARTSAGNATLIITTA